MHDKFEKKLTLRQGISYIIRGLKIINRMFPGFIVLTGVSSFIAATQPMLALYFSAHIIDELAGERNLPRIALYVGIVVCATFLFRIITSFISRRTSLDQAVLGNAIQMLKGKHYAQMDYENVEDSAINEMLADMHAKEMSSGLGLSRLVWSITDLFGALFSVLASGVLLIGMFGTAASVTRTFITSAWSTLTLAVLIILPLILRVFFAKRMAATTAKLFTLLPKNNTAFGFYYRYIQPDGAGKDIRIFNQQSFIMRLISEKSFDWFKAISRPESETAGFTAAANAIVSGVTYLLIGLRALAGMYSIGQVTQYVGAITSFSGSLSSLVSAASMMWENAAYLPMLYDFLDIQSGKTTGNRKVEASSYEFEFHNVSFKYPKSQQFALKNLNFKFDTEKRLAVVGMNGSGKTTMIKLLCRLYDPDEGYISLNGVDIREYNYLEYLKLFSVVFQDFTLLALSLGQNVSGTKDYDGARINSILATVGFDKREEELPNRLDNVLYKEYEEGGVTVSGGEAQKIALARAIYKDAPFIILDEPTAALDPIAEYEIYSRFNDIVGDKTAVFISHRLSSCRFCDDIAVFHKGELVQRGSHDELVTDKDGKYYELWNAQAQYYSVTKVV